MNRDEPTAFLSWRLGRDFFKRGKERESVTEEKYPTTYAEWLAEPFWNFQETLRLLFCPPGPDGKLCPDVILCWNIVLNQPREWKFIRERVLEPNMWGGSSYKMVSRKVRVVETKEDQEKKKFLERQCVKNLYVSKCYRLMLRDRRLSDGDKDRYPEDKPGAVKPRAAIEWALSNDLTLPQPLLDWYNQRKAARQAIEQAGKAVAIAPTIKAAPKARPNLMNVENRKATGEAIQKVLALNRDNWKKDDFLNAVDQSCPRGRYSQTIAEEAWKNLPDNYKLGRGRPKKDKQT